MHFEVNQVGYNYNAIEIGGRLYIARKNRDLRQKDAAIVLGISQSQYSKLELGKIDATVSQLVILAELFNTSLEWILNIKTNNLTSAENLELENYKRYIISKRK